MARNQEKAQAMLNRWTTFKSELRLGGHGSIEKQPRLSRECKSLPYAEQMRRQIVSEVAQKILDIQNNELTEQKIRELNDDINRLLRKKTHWEIQILRLGGRDYAMDKTLISEDEGKAVPGVRGYRYFGAAKDLPGVRELINPPPRKAAKRRKVDLHKNLDLSYYGLVETADTDHINQVLLEKQNEYREADAARNDHVEVNDDSSDGYSTPDEFKVPE